MRLGQEKPALYAGKSPLERLALQAALVRRLASLGSGLPERVARADWPGEVFDIDERNRIQRAAGRPKDLADVDWLEKHPDDE